VRVNSLVELKLTAGAFVYQDTFLVIYSVSKLYGQPLCILEAGI